MGVSWYRNWGLETIPNPSYPNPANSNCGGDDELYIIVVVMITTMMVMMMKLGFSGYHAGGLEAILAKCAVEGNLYTLS